MSDLQEIEEVMKRIEQQEGTKSGKMLVKGSMLVEDENIIRTTFDNTTSQALQKHFLGRLKDLCSHFVREQNPDDQVEFIRADYRERGTEDSCYQVLLGTEGNSNAVLIQEYNVRDLRVRPKEQKDIKGYVHVQKNYFYPSLDRN